MFSSVVVVASLVLNVLAAPLLVKRVEDYIDPRIDGGSMLDASAGLGEPLNVIISANSSPEVLSGEGFMRYVRAIGFAEECFGLHIGNPQQANLGDGQGWVDEEAVIRESLGNLPTWGTCLESLFGGNHFRYWTQATTGAIFLATSIEKDAGKSHDIVDDGYDLGRDALVRGALGTRSYTDDDDVTYTFTTTSVDVEGLLSPGKEGINHDIEIDGIVKVLTVTLEGTERKPKSTEYGTISYTKVIYE